MIHAHSGPTRSLPARPSLVQLRKQAKELLKAYRDGNAAAIGEVERFEHQSDPAGFALSDAQRVLARAYGFSSWSKLKSHVEGPDVNSFFQAVADGDVDAVRSMADARPKLVEFKRGGEYGDRRALHFAVLNRDAEMTRVLMEAGADARGGIWPHRDATTAHTIATERGYNEIVEIIEQEEDRRRRKSSAAGATISSKTDEVHELIRAGARDEAIRILQSDPALIGACNVRGATPLHIAAWAHDPDVVAWLLDREPAVDAQDAEGRTPLDYAAIVAGWSANQEYFCFLENAQKSAALFDETVRLMRDRGAELTPRAAVAIGDSHAVRQMHRDGCLNNEIHFYRGGLLAIAVKVNRIDMVSLLLDLGFDPDETATPDDDGGRSWGTPLWFASMCGRHEIAELLLERGADVNAIVHACGDALGNAYATRDERMISLLREHGARITVERVGLSRDTETGRQIVEGTLTAESLNVEDPTSEQLIEQLLWAAACGGDPEIVRMCLPLIRRKPGDHWWHYILSQPLRIWNHATLHNHDNMDRSTYPECLRLILESGVHPDVGPTSGTTQLHEVAASTEMTSRERLNFAKILLDAGASLKRRDDLLQSTPLGWACRWGRPELVELYLQCGADAVESDAEPWATPLAWAEKGRHQQIIDLLCLHRAEGRETA